MGLFKRMALVALCLAFTLPASARDMVVRATWYGAKYHRHLMKSGLPFNMYDPTIVAARDLPLYTRLRLTNVRNGRSITATVLDKSPYAALDCSRAAAEVLDFVGAGVATLRVDIIN